MHESDRYRLIMTVPSSMMQLFPITTGPVCPKMTTFGCTTVPATVKYKFQSAKVNASPLPVSPWPIVTSPRISTSAQVIDFE